MTFHIKNGKSLSSYIKTIMEDSVKQAMYQRALQEKEKQNNMANSIGSDVDEAPDKSSKTFDDDYESLKKGEISADDIIEKLNSIRSGRSFKDDEVKNNMEEYVDSLSKAERTAMLAFLKGISQIVTGEIPGPKAIEPSKDPSNVSMKKGPGAPKVKHIKPNVIKTQKPEEDKKKSPPPEDTSGPVPITPKKK